MLELPYCNHQTHFAFSLEGYIFVNLLKLNGKLSHHTMSMDRKQCL